MLSTQEFARPTHVRVAVVVDLIGDLDAMLGTIFADAMRQLSGNGTTDVHLTTRHVAASTRDGLAAIEAAVADARRRGCCIAVDPGNRRMRAAFSAASISTLPDTDVAMPAHARHLMIARHAPVSASARLRESA